MIFFKKIKLIYIENKVDLIIIICLIFLFAFLILLNNIYYMLVLKKLYPEYSYFSVSIKEIIVKIIIIFYSKIKNGYYFDKEQNDYKNRYKFVLDIIGNVLSFFGFLIYLEMIELNFCGFNYNLRKNIIKRSNDDMFNNNDSQNESINYDDSQNKSINYDDISNKNSELSSQNL